MTSGRSEEQEDPSNQQLSYIYSNLSALENELTRMRNLLGHYFRGFI